MDTPPYNFYSESKNLMAITEQDVDRIARLARIELTPVQNARSQEELTGILNLMQQLQSVDTSGIEPLAHPLADRQDVTLRLRPDVARATATQDERQALMANAAGQQDGLFLVPTVIE